ncbi:hypothetical protein MLD38_020400 [Melastoma candidum]|uniref:Uncharacterized protein n=1 Tax=Melastoma candidum TaxID=119954 RepID=A0ACB9QCT1_9MYRT|nr:hypothetical protein MLD38_020400 [Melastoma candidum]
MLVSSEEDTGNELGGGVECDVVEATLQGYHGHPPPHLHLDAGPIPVIHISDGCEDSDQGAEPTLKDRVERLRAGLTRSLVEFLNSPAYLERPATVLIYDSFFPYVLDIALLHGLHGAPFFTQSAAVCSIYYLAHAGNVRVPLVGKSPELSMLGTDDLISPPSCPMGTPIRNSPSSLFCQLSNLRRARWMLFNTFVELEEEVRKISVYELVLSRNSYPELTQHVIGQFSNFRNAGWMRFDTFADLEEEVVKRFAREWPLLMISLTVQSMYSDQRLKDGNDVRPCRFDPEVEASMKWLDSKEACFVAYVSFVASWCSEGGRRTRKGTGSRGSKAKEPTNAKFIVDMWKVGAMIGRNERGIATVTILINALARPCLTAGDGRSGRDSLNGKNLLGGHCENAGVQIKTSTDSSQR